MIAEFAIHGTGDLVEGKIDLGSGIHPAIGWEFNLDLVFLRVEDISFYLGESVSDHIVRLDLVLQESSRSEWSAQRIVDFLRKCAADYLTLTEVAIEGYCNCKHEPH